MNTADAQGRLYLRYDIDADLHEGDVLAAELALGALAPFTEDVDLDNPPDALLDWVALKAHHIATTRPEGKISSGVETLRYATAWPQLTPVAKRLQALASPYLKRTGARV